MVLQTGCSDPDRGADQPDPRLGVAGFNALVDPVDDRVSETDLHLSGGIVEFKIGSEARCIALTQLT